jgi:hypothetical protein
MFIVTTATTSRGEKRNNRIRGCHGVKMTTSAIATVMVTLVFLMITIVPTAFVVGHGHHASGAGGSITGASPSSAALSKTEEAGTATGYYHSIADDMDGIGSGRSGLQIIQQEEQQQQEEEGQHPTSGDRMDNNDNSIQKNKNKKNIRGTIPVIDAVALKGKIQKYAVLAES